MWTLTRNKPKSIEYVSENTGEIVGVDKSYGHKNQWFVTVPSKKSGEGMTQLLSKKGKIEKLWLPEASVYQYQGFSSRDKAIAFAMSYMMKGLFGKKKLKEVV